MLCANVDTPVSVTNMGVNVASEDSETFILSRIKPYNLSSCKSDKFYIALFCEELDLNAFSKLNFMHAIIILHLIKYPLINWLQ